MRIVRYLDPSGEVQFAHQQNDQAFFLELPDGTLFGRRIPTDRPVVIQKVLAPVEPVQILCIGLNYRRHAAESNAPLPERPILFTKGINALQNPGDAIEIPVCAASDEVD